VRPASRGPRYARFDYAERLKPFIVVRQCAESPDQPGEQVGAVQITGFVQFDSTFSRKHLRRYAEGCRNQSQEMIVSLVVRQGLSESSVGRCGMPPT